MNTMQQRERIHRLFQQYQSGTISPTAWEELLILLSGIDENDADTLTEPLQQLWQQAAQQQLPSTAYQIDHNKMFNTIITSDATYITPMPVRPMRKTWHWAAAAILILAIGSGIYYFGNQSYKPNAINGGTGETVGAMEDAAPGTNRAILTINNNQNIDLATNKTGINVNNTITYNDGEKIADAGQMLQLSTPRGGQYQAVLPDGSRVWLNAASSIRLPSKFSNKERKVEVTGEAYFEIAKDSTKPFKVSGGGQEIEVLGTSFNINVYDDEPIKKTTLLTGSIKITHNNQTAILQPGQQANIPILSILPIRLILVQTSDIIAWTNNLFYFNQSPLPEVMRQIARWYNVDVEYTGKIPDRLFNGKIQRSLPLTSVLSLLVQSDIHCRLEGKTIIIGE